MFLSLSVPIVVLWIHILAATIWIGGQMTLTTLVPLLRGVEGLATAAGRRFQRIAWAAFALLVITGIWNVHSAGISWSNLNGTAAGRTLSVKLAFVLLSGLGAAIHAYYLGPAVGRERSRRAGMISGICAGIGLLAAVIAALYGVIIAEH